MLSSVWFSRSKDGDRDKEQEREVVVVWICLSGEVGRRRKCNDGTKMKISINGMMGNQIAAMLVEGKLIKVDPARRSDRAFVAENDPDAFSSSREFDNPRLLPRRGSFGRFRCERDSS
jgi:hypothetical protein